MRFKSNSSSKQVQATLSEWIRLIEEIFQENVALKQD